MEFKSSDEIRDHFVKKWSETDYIKGTPEYSEAFARMTHEVNDAFKQFYASKPDPFDGDRLPNLPNRGKFNG